ncbi:hypothetical protein CANARDRAFT_28175 [[Candida] arabinofermentans NRRL YB-2248]|uniref:Protein phosphatase n=1 Tax=[Candida] arabinofermentans NRRL YB-2248 TaxID=983967 RepID=A0A1E4T0X6_9ASCO|nr:hypothetical protein CANARDRAFT_28175 [[Candida] arabinofermentans NRRL YB-2248]
MFISNPSPSILLQHLNHHTRTTILKSNSRILLRTSTQRRLFTGDAYHNFKNFKNGHTIIKDFKNNSSSFVLSVSFEPKDRLKETTPSESDTLLKNYRRKIMNSNDAFGSPTGEDNYIMAYSEQGVIAGVLDGVGGWSEQGYDSSAISRELSDKVTSTYLQHPEQPALQILEDAFKQVKNEGIVEVGSTTICYGIIDSKSLKMHALNLGDSWFGIFRQIDDHWKCIYESKEQTYYFNAPYQLSIIPDEFLENAKKKGSKYLMNEPNEAELYEYQLQSGDLVLFTTDGLIDNIVISDVSMYLDQNFDLELIGEVNTNLVSNVKSLSLNTHFKSVFSQRLSEITGQDYVGGKPDDVTTVMVHVT